MSKNNGGNISLLEKSAESEEVSLDIVKLPSRGLLYPESHPFHMAESVEFRSMGTPEENILASGGLVKKGKAVTALIRSCLTNKLVDPSSLLIGDKSAILLAIRNSGFGTDYKAKTKCPECGGTWKHTFDLRNCQYKFLSEMPAVPGQNLFSFTLPFSKREVTFKLLTDADDIDIAKTQEQRKKVSNSEVDTTITDRLIHQIVSIGQITDKDAIAREITNSVKMPSKEVRPLRAYIRSIEPDVIFSEEVECKFCGVKEEHPIPLGVEFLWPKLDD